MNKIDQIRTVLNIAFMIGAVASVVLFRFSIRNRQGGKP